MKFSGKMWSDIGTTDSILGQFGETAQGSNANFFVSILSTLPAIDSSGSPVLPSSN